jgi:hypothetical protein
LSNAQKGARENSPIVSSTHAGGGDNDEKVNLEVRGSSTLTSFDVFRAPS